MSYTYRYVHQQDALKQQTRYTIRLRSALSSDGKRVLRQGVVVDRQGVFAAKRGPFTQGLEMAPPSPLAIYDLFGSLVPIVAAALRTRAHYVFLESPLLHYSRIPGRVQSLQIARVLLFGDENTVGLCHSPGPVLDRLSQVGCLDTLAPG